MGNTELECELGDRERFTCLSRNRLIIIIKSFITMVVIHHKQECAVKAVRLERLVGAAAVSSRSLIIIIVILMRKSILPYTCVPGARRIREEQTLAAPRRRRRRRKKKKGEKWDAKRRGRTPSVREKEGESQLLRLTRDLGLTLTMESEK